MIASVMRETLEALIGDDDEDDHSFVGYESFGRQVQWDTYSCVPRSVYATLRHFGKRADFRVIKRELRTTEEGTEEQEVVRYMRKRGFRVRPDPRMTMRALRAALASGAVVLGYFDGDHMAVIYGMDRDYVYVADPSIIRAPFGRLTRERFRTRWDNDGLVVKPK
jgi:ABC-type bacteriocin/lantibiotic exporter with double-glycine peptidase domain